MSAEFEVSGQNAAALFTLKLHRGEGATLVAMDWKNGRPPADFVGFGIEYQPPGSGQFFPVKNRLAFPGADGSLNPNTLSSKQSPIQKFRWVHFPPNAELAGAFTYRVTPVFMDEKDELSYGETQQAALELRRETFPDQMNVTFTRGFVSSQAFVDRYESKGDVSLLLPSDPDKGLDFKPTHPLADEALAWMGFEARAAIFEILDQAIADPTAQVRVVAYDLNVPDFVSRLEKLKARLKVIIDDSGSHGPATSAETAAAARLAKSAGKANVKRQHMGSLQHNKTITVQGKKINAAIFGSTNDSWRGFYVQANNAIVARGAAAAKVAMDAFQNYWDHSDDVAGFGATTSATWNDLGLAGIDAKVTYSPHSAKNAALANIGKDMSANTTANLFFSLAFLYQTKGPIRDAVTKFAADDTRFVYGISDKEVGGLDLQKPDGTVAVVHPDALTDKDTPEPFKSEPTGGAGIRMHHKFVVIDFNKPTARVYMGSYNFSGVADRSNGENLLLIKDRRVAVSYMIEALRLVDHYQFRTAQKAANDSEKVLELAKPPRKAGEKAWFEEYFTDAKKILDRTTFA